MPPKAPTRPVAVHPSDQEADETAALRLVETGRSPAEIAHYIAEFSAELSFLARQARLDLLAYLLDMARLEAVRTVQTDRKRG